MKKGKLTLVGAGPGDPELISIKGLKAIQEAKVVLYDALVHPSLLDHCKPGTIKVFVGKRADKHQFIQGEINKMIVDYALSHELVVRLKGGDPFIFGRGKEEIEHAKKNGMETEVIPGISSLNLPGLNEVPLTSRGVNESIWVVTGTTSSKKISQDLTLAAKSSATVVVFMGLKKVKEIANVFTELGKENTPVMIIEKGSLEDQRIFYGFINNIEKIVIKEKVDSPALIIIGNTTAQDQSS